MTTSGWIFALIAILNAIGAIYAWKAKINWSKEYRLATDRMLEAKDAQIQVLEKQIDQLERLNPKELAGWSEGIIQQSSRYVDGLKKQLDESKTVIMKLESEGRAKDEQVLKANKAHEDLSKDYNALKLSADQHILPNVSTYLSSVSSSGVLADTTSVESPDVNLFLKSIWDNAVDESFREYLSKPFNLQHDKDSDKDKDKE